MPLIEKFIEIEASVGRVFDLASDLENFPRWMSNIKRVRRIDRYATRWTAETAFGRDAEWEAVTTQYEPDQRIVWHSVRGDVDTAGEIVLSETRRGTTLMRVCVDYDVPVGASRAEAAAITSIFGDNPHRQLEDDLRRFKHIVERAAPRENRAPIVRREGRPREDYREEHDAKYDARHGREESRVKGIASPRRMMSDRSSRMDERSRDERFDEALRAARHSQERDMERYREERGREMERREQYEAEAHRRTNEGHRARDARESNTRIENRRLISPRERMREMERARETSGRRIDREYPQRFGRRGVDLLLDDETPSRRFRRGED